MPGSCQKAKDGSNAWWQASWHGRRILGCKPLALIPRLKTKVVRERGLPSKIAGNLEDLNVISERHAQTLFCFGLNL